jgi:hypothetical protein
MGDRIPYPCSGCTVNSVHNFSLLNTDHGKGTPAFHYGMAIISGADVNFFTDFKKREKESFEYVSTS